MSYYKPAGGAGGGVGAGITVLSGQYQISGIYPASGIYQISGIYAISGGTPDPLTVNTINVGTLNVSGNEIVSGLFVGQSGTFVSLFVSGKNVLTSFQNSGIYQSSGVFQASGIYPASGVYQLSGVALTAEPLNVGTLNVSGPGTFSGLFVGQSGSFTNLVISGSLLFKQPFTYFVYSPISGTYRAINSSGIIQFTDSTLSGFTTVSNLALAAMSGHGGLLLIDQGTHKVSKAGVGNGRNLGLQYTASNTTMAGMGHSTILQVDSVLSGMLNVICNYSGDNGYMTTDVTIKDLTVDGNKPSINIAAGYGGAIRPLATDHVTLENILVINAACDGIQTGGNPGNPARSVAGSGQYSYLVNCIVRDANENSYDLPSYFIKMTNCQSIYPTPGAGSIGFDLDGPQWSEFVNCLNEGGNQGFDLKGGITAGVGNFNRSTAFNQFTNCISRGTSGDGFALGQTQSGASGNSSWTTMTSCMVDGGGQDGIDIRGNTTNVIINGFIIKNVSGIGIQLLSGVNKVDISNLEILDAGNMGIQALNSSTDISIDNCHMTKIGVVGIFLNSGINNVKISNTDIDMQAASGILQDGIRIIGSCNNPQLSNVHIKNARLGFYVQQTSGTQYSNCIAENNFRYGFYSFGSDRTIYMNCTSYDNSRELSGIYDGFILDGDGTVGNTSRAKIIGCNSYNSAGFQRNGIRLTTFTDGCLIADNNLSGNISGMVISGTNHLVHHNMGYATENKGILLDSGNASKVLYTVAHGLSNTPTSVIVNAGSPGARGDFDVSGGAANITVTYPVAPSSGAVNLIWSAVI